MDNKYQREKPPREEDPGKPGEICILINSIFYYINSVIILNNRGHYHLVVNHNGKVLVDNIYKTLRGAKIAFSKLFSHRGWRENLKAEWSVFYKPDPRWLKKSCVGIRTMEE